MMKIWKIFFIILGIIFLLFGLMGVSLMDLGKEEDTAYKIGYIIGALVSFIPSFLFFYLAHRLHRKLEKKKLNQAMDSFLSNDKSV